MPQNASSTCLQTLSARLGDPTILSSSTVTAFLGWLWVCYLSKSVNFAGPFGDDILQPSDEKKKRHEVVMKFRYIDKVRPPSGMILVLDSPIL